MSLPAPLGSEAAAQLRAELAPPEPDSGGAQARSKGVLDRLPDRLVRVARRTAGRAIRPVVNRAAAPGLEAAAEAARMVAQLDRSLDSLRDDAVEREFERDGLRTGLVNLELLKGEVRAAHEELERLGRAIAPAFGLPAAATALAELRERVTACERRLRHLETTVGALSATDVVEAGGSSGADPAAPSPAPPPTTVTSTFLDYAGLERRFRGDPSAIVEVLADRYGELLAGHQPVLDVGCGRAELIELLTARGVEASGIDTDPSMVADAQERGLAVVGADAVSYLRSEPPGSYGAIIAIHVLEHLQLSDLVELVDLCRSRLRPEGVFIAETPNPASLIVLGNSYILDPTHVRPLHPKLMEFLCEAAGFRSLELHFYSPAEAFQLHPVDVAEAPHLAEQVNEAFGHLNHVLFGPQDYAIVATRGGDGAP